MFYITVENHLFAVVGPGRSGELATRSPVVICKFDSSFLISSNIIGRRAGLKNQWDFSLAGSIPAPVTF
jgi:hypothetical protein